jgi:hypothetical protein
MISIALLNGVGRFHQVPRIALSLMFPIPPFRDGRHLLIFLKRVLYNQVEYVAKIVSKFVEHKLHTERDFGQLKLSSIQVAGLL